MTTVKKTHWLRFTLIVLAVCAVAGIILAAVQFMNEKNRTYAVASLQFSFKTAGEGIAPDGNPYDTKWISSDDVITAALQASGLADTYTADQIRGSLNVTAVYPESIVEKMTRYTSILDASADQQATLADYQATIYSVELFNTFDPAIPSDQLTGLLNNLLEAFRNDFARTGGPSLSRVDPIADLQEYDYPQQLTVISEASAQQSAYAQEMAEKAPDFRKDGMSFDDIVTRYESLDSDISRLNASISLNALSKDRERLQKQYEMELRTLNRKLASTQEELTRVEEQVASYEKDGIIYVSTSGSLQKVSSNSSNTYDKLVSKRKQLTDSITTINADIAKYQALLADMTTSGRQTKQTATTLTENTESAETNEAKETTEETVSTSVELSEEELRQMTAIIEEKIQNLINKKSTITADFTSMLNAYTRQEINPQTVSITRLKYESPSFFSGEFAKKVLNTAGPFCAVGFMVCLVLLIISRRKEEKAKA